VGVDLAKRVIQVHAVDAAGQLVLGRALARDRFIAWCAQLPGGCVVAMEASSSAHHWARKLCSLGLDARIIAAHLVKPYRKQGSSGKNDANDAGVSGLPIIPSCGRRIFPTHQRQGASDGSGSSTGLRAG
jgi:transposase